MSEIDLHWLSLVDMAARLRSRALSPVEVTQALLERIDALEHLHAYVTLLPEAALEAARTAEAELARGEVRGPLHGVPLAVKDICATKGVPTACGTRVLADRRPDHTATVVERLEAAGAVILGKLQLTEGAYGWHHPDVTDPVNPWSADHWPGVSSSGSGAATAAGLCYGSLGSDTGGSIRFPSSACGLTGIKPTYGRVSRYGVFPLAHSLDHIGPMTRSVADGAAMLGVLAGHDPRDPTSLRAPVPDYSQALAEDVRGLRVGIDERYVSDQVDETVIGATFSALECFRELGAEIVAVTVPPVDALIAGWVPTTAAECAIAHSDTFPSHADAYGPQLRALLELGPTVTAMQYARIEQERVRFQAALVDLFGRVDLLVAPAMPVPPPRLELADQVPNLLQFTAPFDYSGSPTVTLPGGFTDDGLPIGFQLIGRHLDEAGLCRAAHAYQRATDWHLRRPLP